MRLIPYELGKIWRKQSFLVLTGLLLLMNLFFVWYLSVPEEGEPPLSAYKVVCADLSKMNESEKLAYITALKERTDRYRGGADLKYTSDIYLEQKLLNELYTEIRSVSEYEGYLESIQKKKESLSGISVFSAAAQSAFGSRNIEKSAEDHRGQTAEHIRWVPSKGYAVADQNSVSDILMLLSVFLFAGSLITEEKEKRLFYITRTTKKGVFSCMAAKLAAFAVHCLAISFLLEGMNYIYAGFSVGLGDMTASLQSAAPFMESSLSVSLLEYIVLGILTKAMVLFDLGAALVWISVISTKSFVPQLAGVLWLAANGLAYTLIPAYSTLNPIKYLSFFGRMNAKQLYGEYLNLNFAEYPVSRLTCALLLTGLFCILGITTAVLLFSRGKSLEIHKVYHRSLLPFRPHCSLLVHEGYKILFMGKAVVILLLFAVLIGYTDLGKSYSPSVGEQYYWDIMRILEGEMTEEKEAFILAEQARYDEAFAQMKRIDDQVLSGELEEAAGRDLKTKWAGEVSFYPSFQRVLGQYEHIRKNGGVFIYDTGYRYLFGMMDNSHLIDFLLLSVCLVFAFGNVMAMEAQNKSWHLLSVTEKGKKKILMFKMLVCTLCTVGMAVLPWLFHCIAVGSVYPLHQSVSAVTNLPMFYTFGIGIPIWAFLLSSCILQITAMMAVLGGVLLFSGQCKNYLQAVFLSLLVLVVPPALTVMGIDFAKWFSLYPLYHLMGM